MFSNRLSPIAVGLMLSFMVGSGCSSLPPPSEVSPIEQLRLDSEKAKGLMSEFEHKTSFKKMPQVEGFLGKIARDLSAQSKNLKTETIRVRVHRDQGAGLKHAFSFPGSLISIPYSFLQRINFENELAALLALELAHLDRRWLALQLEKESIQGEIRSIPSLFEFSKTQLQESIEIGVRMMYLAGYDPRGMVGLFENFPEYFINLQTEQDRKDQQSLIRQSQKSKNEYMPLSQPIVRSNEFLRMKKELMGST